jgi:hypothetical protein
MEHSDLLRHLTLTLERLGIRYLITGSSATIFFGEPRFTNDIDVVVVLTADRIHDLLAAFPSSEFYVSEEAARRAVEQRAQFNIIHPASGLKVDVIVSGDSAFDHSRFHRAVRVHPSDFDASFASPEDVIIKKMQYFEEGGSEKHLRDIAGVLKVMGEQIDRRYIAEWAQRLGVGEIWQRVIQTL